MRDQFTFYRSFWDALKALPARDRLPFVMAVGSYVFEETMEEPSGAALASFLLVKPVLDKASKRAASGKQGGSKRQANAKQTGSKPEANAKQTGSEKEGEVEREIEREIEREGENDSSSPPCPPSGETRPQKTAPQKPPADDWGFGPELTEAFRAWLRYKAEKRQGYKPEGLLALVSETRHNAERYGEAAVAALIRKCMSANWQGIIWERLERMPVEKQAACDKDVAWMRKYVDQRRREEGGT